MPVRTRSDVAKEVAPEFGLTLQDADRFVLLVLEEIKGILKSGDEVVFKGFGRFAPVRQEGRIRRNPQTGERIITPAKNIVKFKPYGDLAELPLEVK
ncbi:TPA: HU family DNA-binding protein [Candidatus Poribacteria bacterium]|nr:HU family DNA-binding protein [Candidatus Poribacteria bacterium]